MSRVIPIREEMPTNGWWEFFPIEEPQPEVKPKRQPMAWQWKVLIWLGALAYSTLFWYGVARGF